MIDQYTAEFSGQCTDFGVSALLVVKSLMKVFF